MYYHQLDLIKLNANDLESIEMSYHTGIDTINRVYTILKPAGIELGFILEGVDIATCS